MKLAAITENHFILRHNFLFTHQTFICQVLCSRCPWFTGGVNNDLHLLKEFQLLLMLLFILNLSGSTVSKVNSAVSSTQRLCPPAM